jgi:Xaa-Pro aminopeptidase
MQVLVSLKEYIQYKLIHLVHKYHQVIILKTGIIDHVIAGVYFPGVGGMGIVNA